MRLNVIVSTMIAAAVCSQAYALQITKGKLISHKEKFTMGAKGVVTPGTKTLQSLKAKGNEAPNDIFPVGLIADMQPVTTIAGSSIDIGNNAFISVTNTSNQTRDYNYTVVTCAASEVANNTECVQYFNVISLEPNGTFWDSVQPMLTMTYHARGVYNTYAGTYYSAMNHEGDNPDSYENGSSSATGTITVA